MHERLRAVAEPAPEALGEQARPAGEDEARHDVQRKGQEGLRGADRPG